MRIIRPYGSSKSQRDGAGALRRLLIDNSPGRGEHDIPSFASSHDELIIAQWISAIDKIAGKPTGRKNPTSAQRSFRNKLGNACWMRMTDGGHLPGANTDKRAHLNDLWWFKIHPYGPGIEEARSDRHQSRPPSPKVKGRWYAAFAGDGEPEQADVQEIAMRIEKHLYEREYRLGKEARPKRDGKIKSRAESISSNVLTRRTKRTEPATQWTDTEKAAYTQPGDPVRAIAEEARSLKSKNKRIGLQVAGKILFEHWREVFRDPLRGASMSVEEAHAAHPRMFALHQQIKQCYRRLLKRTRKDTHERRKRDPNGRSLSDLMPRDLEAALRLSIMQVRNADLAGLVRVGKVIHYTVSDGQPDSTRPINDRWPARESVDASRFWSSDGQAEIKRAEAFVRIWRHSLVLAGLTLRDWISFEGDILGDTRKPGGKIDKAIEALRSSETKRIHFDKKCDLLFGKHAKELNIKTDDDRIRFLCGLVDGVADLRHAAFHFKGRRELVHKLEELPNRYDAQRKEAAQGLWRADVAERTDRLKTTLRTGHAETFLAPEQLAQVFELLTVEGVAALPLPRFARVLTRFKNAWGADNDSARARDKSIRLPKPANRTELKVAPARLCQYTVLKLIYERSFRVWLKDRRAEEISGWMSRAVSLTTEEAQRLNPKDVSATQVISSRAAHLPKPPPGSDIRDFFFNLSAATASEMRVQSGYESDPEKAHEQAAYIDDLMCDVMILSFSSYISQRELGWVLDIEGNRTMSEGPTCSLTVLRAREPDLAAEDWLAALYLLLHLLPVETVGQLLHQLFKWEITAGRNAELTEEEKTRLKWLIAAKTLYLDMHDAKFEGGSAFVGCEAFRDLYESDEGFNRLFSTELGPEADRRIPRRGLREIMRFGHMPVLRSVCSKEAIDDETINQVVAMEAARDSDSSQIAHLQQKREGLHEKWVRNKRHLEATELEEYCETLAKISIHRRNSNFVNLVDHVRAHRLIMAVLGRLVDYAGLFERDLYFVTLAVLHRQGLRPDELLDEKGLDLLGNGQIIFALRQHKQGDQEAEVLKELASHFTEVWADKSPTARIRNSLAHLNMLQGSTPEPRLSYWVNQARRLMSYDRKLGNAVSKSVIELLAREGIELHWNTRTDGGQHVLVDARLLSRRAEHLGRKRLESTDGSKPALITEPLHSRGYIGIIATAFEGTTERAKSILDDLSAVDWDRSARRKAQRKNGGPQQPRSA